VVDVQSFGFFGVPTFEPFIFITCLAGTVQFNDSFVSYGARKEGRNFVRRLNIFARTNN
jgi:hypothetical protein